MESITLSRGRLLSFLHCQRQFELRYVNRLPWPYPPPELNTPAFREAAQQDGELFHQLVAQAYTGFPPLEEAQFLALPERVQGWWNAFQTDRPRLEEGDQPLPEYTLQVPVGQQMILGRFDLLLVGPDQVRIFDWKTGRIPNADDLKDDWQTRFYLGLVYEGRAALRVPDLKPDAISMVYWYSQRPHRPIEFRYDADWHAQSWGEVVSIVSEMETLLEQTEIWPLTADRERCQTCEFAAYCGRDGALFSGEEADQATEEGERPETFSAETEAAELEPDPR